jgi:uncharacterized protein YjbI with pentapeptide repeats
MEIKNRYTREIILTFEISTDLRGADLTDADLTNADLTDADLTNADLRGANQSRVANDPR